MPKESSLLGTVVGGEQRCSERCGSCGICSQDG